MTSVPSGYSYDFTATPPDDLTCSICLCVFRDPHLTSCCGKHYCEACVSRVKSDRKPCPLCKEKHFTTMLDKSICRKVNQLQVKCPNGCKFIGELGSVDKHVSGSCLFVLVQCDFKCGAEVLWQQLDTHKTRDCPLRPHSCQYCNFKADYKRIRNAHFPVCPKFPVSCPNNCTSLKMERQSIGTHLKEDCPLTKVSCFFEFAGCTNKIERKDEEEHAKENALNHLQMATDAYLTLKNRSSKQDNEIKELQISLRKRQK